MSFIKNLLSNKDNNPCCSQCRKPMQEWLESGGVKYCSDKCFESSWPKCEICRSPMQEWTESQSTGKKYCSSNCYQHSLPTCDVCSVPMEQWKENSSGKKYCSERCVKTSWPKCWSCSVCMDSWYIVENGTYCSDSCITNRHGTDALAKKIRKNLDEAAFNEVKCLDV